MNHMYYQGGYTNHDWFKRHVFHLIEPMLPLPRIYLRTKEIDTIDDYERAVQWIRNGYEG